MELKDQCCTKEQALRLVELGVKPRATFYHMKAKDGPHGEYIAYGWTSHAIAPAYNVAELGEILPSETYTMRTGSPSSAYANWEWVDQGSDRAMGLFNTEAEARADQLIFLLERNLFELPAEWCQKQPEPVKEITK